MKKFLKTNSFYYTIKLIAFSVIFTITGYSQELQVPKGKIYTTDGREILFSNLEQKENEFSFIYEYNKTTIPNNKIAQIDKEIGNEAGKWALYLGLSGLLGSALGVAQASAETGYSNSSANTTIILGLTGLSAGIGALIGYGKKKYETVYTNPNYEMGKFFKNSRLDLSIGNANSFVFTFRHKF